MSLPDLSQRDLRHLPRSLLGLIRHGREWSQGVGKICGVIADGVVVATVSPCA